MLDWAFDDTGTNVTGRAALAVAVTVATACARRPGAAVLKWGGENIFAREQLVIDANGTGEYANTHDGKNGRRGFQLSAAQLAALHDRLLAHHVCALRSAVGYRPVADESQTTLTLRFPDLTCEVSLWDNEWDGSPDAADIDEAIRALR